MSQPYNRHHSGTRPIAMSCLLLPAGNAVNVQPAFAATLTTVIDLLRKGATQLELSPVRRY